MVLWEALSIADDGKYIYNFISACKGGGRKEECFREGGYL